VSSSYDELNVFSGNANPALARAVADYIGIPLGQIDLVEFSNENLFVRIRESVRANDIFVIQSLSSPVNTSIMELLIMIDAFRRASAGRITAVVPYYAYGRTDKKDQPRVAITARLLADMITVAGADRVLTLDLHAGQIEGFFNIPVDHLTAAPILQQYFQARRLREVVVVAPDLGSAKRARNFAEGIGAPLALIEKRRIANDGNSEVLTLIGSVEGRPVIIVDDEIDTAGSVCQATETVLRHGATDVYAACTHGVLSGPAIERLAASPLREIVITDTIPLPPRKHLDKLRVLSIAPLIGETIQRIHTGTTVGTMRAPFQAWAGAGERLTSGARRRPE
jgi:ribose-phosphate pyrophosphokinase